MRFHILGIPHTASNRDWLCCAFTQKVIKLCAMLKARGHYVIHYGNAASDVHCDEHVSVTASDDVGPPEDYLSFDQDSRVYKIFHHAAIAAIEKRKQPHDFLLCMWGHGHRPVAEAHSDLLVVEPGIGYARGHFAPFKVFESYALLHAFYGLDGVETPGKLKWYDVVIPNYFDPADFEFRYDKEDFLLFLGRVIYGKGVQIAVEIARAAAMKLVVAGPGEYDGVETIGPINAEQRRDLLARAKALIAPSTYAEPFCGTVTEAHFSGTPAITSDWGAFAENNLHGITGFRCRTYEHFVWAVNNIDRISPEQCRAFAEQNFTMDRISEMYDEYFWSVMAIATGKGWYEMRQRQDLDWLTRCFPSR